MLKMMNYLKLLKLRDFYETNCTLLKETTDNHENALNVVWTLIAAFLVSAVRDITKTHIVKFVYIK